jgi:hypothetical protein
VCVPPLRRNSNLPEEEEEYRFRDVLPEVTYKSKGPLSLTGDRTNLHGDVPFELGTPSTNDSYPHSKEDHSVSPPSNKDDCDLTAYDFAFPEIENSRQWFNVTALEKKNRANKTNLTKSKMDRWFRDIVGESQHTKGRDPVSSNSSDLAGLLSTDSEHDDDYFNTQTRESVGNREEEEQKHGAVRCHIRRVGKQETDNSFFYEETESKGKNEHLSPPETPDCIEVEDTKMREANRHTDSLFRRKDTGSTCQNEPLSSPSTSDYIQHEPTETCVATQMGASLGSEEEEEEDPEYNDEPQLQLSLHRSDSLDFEIRYGAHQNTDSDYD